MRVHYLLPPLLLAFACGKQEAPPPPPAPVASAPMAVAIKAVTLGKALGADKRIAEATTTFAAKDVIYASVETTGSADRAKLEAKWTFLGAKGPVAVSANAMDLLGLTGPAHNEFHIAKPTGWPKGAYQVEIYLNGVSATRKDFQVK